MPAKPGPLRPHEERRSYTRRERSAPVPGLADLGDTFLIVTEGLVTERRYCERLREKLNLSAAHVQVVQPGFTDAAGLIRAAIRLRDETRTRAPHQRGNSAVSSYDHVWAVFDADVSERLGTLPAALDLARREQIHVALSTPCIEVWLLLYFRDRPGPFNSSSEACRALAEAWGQAYDKHEATFAALWPVLLPGIPIAVRRAEATRAYHQAATTSPPANPSADMDRLVLSLNAASRPEMRILH